MAKKKYYRDVEGNMIAGNLLDPHLRKKTDACEAILKDFLKAEQLLIAVRDKAEAQIRKVVESSEKSTGVKRIGGPKGNIQFSSLDGTIRVAIDAQARTEYDDRMAAAKQLFFEAVEEMEAKVSDLDIQEIKDLATIVRSTFTPNKHGNLSKAKVQMLRDLKNVKNDKWQRALKIINDCEVRIGSRRYIRVSHREAPDKQFRNILLDIAKV